MTQTQPATLDHQGGSLTVWLRFALLFTLLGGGVYPAATTLLGHTLFPRQAEGSLLERNGAIVGSALVGQPFSASRYFIPRPSAAGDGYDPTNVSGSNLSVSNPDLRARAEATSRQIAQREGAQPEQIPVDLIAASGSGLDPHISPEGASLQVPRVARSRGLPETNVLELVQSYTERNPLGLGMPGVNVVELNLALDELEQ